MPTIATKLLGGALLTLTFLTTAGAAAAQHPGGILENISSLPTRDLPTATEIQSFLPSRGEFTFPAPWNTEGVRLTNASDCGGSNCLWYVGYSYWRNINNHAGSDTMFIFLGLDRNRGGTGPTLFQYDKVTGEVTNLGGLFPSTHYLSWATGEGWYFSATMPNKLYVSSGPKLMRHDVVTGHLNTVIDIQQKLLNLEVSLLDTHLADLVNSVLAGATYIVFQTHSSNDDRVHSATLKDGSTWAAQGCIVYREDTDELSYFPSSGYFDECQVDRSGEWLVIKEDNNNRIINIESGNERLLLDPDGAVGHSDMGYGYVIGADNFAAEANAWKAWDFNLNPLSGTTTYHNDDWYTMAPAHVSHLNAKPGLPVDEQYGCGSTASSNPVPHGNEVICFRMDSSGDVLAVAPVMTDMGSAVGGDSYAKLPKGNLDVTGEYFIWTSNAGGSRVDAFIAKVPGHLLAGSTDSGGSGSGDSGSDDGTDSGGSGSDGDDSGDSGSGDSGSTTDTTAPVITVTGSVVGDATATVTWTTNENASSTVEYGLTTSYGSMTAVGPTGTSHSHTVSGLQPGTTYHANLISTDPAGNTGSSGDLRFTTGGETPTQVQAEDVSWVDLVNVTADGNSLVKTSGCNGCGDAGASSSQQIDSGNSYLQFTLSSTDGLRYIGLGDTVAGDNAGDLDFAFRLQGNYAEVRENGSYRSDTAVAVGDVMRIEVSDGQVQYSKNGDVFYTSANAPAFPMRADAVMFSLHSSLGNVVIGVPVNAGDSPEPTLADVSWTNIVNATVDGNSLTKTSGCNGCGDAGAASGQQIESGDGYLEFTVEETSLMRYVGLASDATGNDAGSIDFAVRLQSGYAEVRENGFYRTDIPVLAGDVLRIEVSAGVVSYARNGTVFYTSGAAPGYPLRADVVLNSLNSTITGAVMFSSGAGDTSTAPESSPAPAVPAAVTWQDAVHVKIDGNSIRKQGGCNGCPDAGASSVEQIASGDGYLELTAVDSETMRYVGLSSASAGNDASAIDFAIRIQDGIAEVREFGAWRSDTSVSGGDIFRIEIEGGQVNYQRNGDTFHTSDLAPSYPLKADAVLFEKHSGVSNAMMQTVQFR